MPQNDYFILENAAARPRVWSQNVFNIERLSFFFGVKLLLLLTDPATLAALFLVAVFFLKRRFPFFPPRLL